MNKNIQYELWQECNNHCTYCTLGRSNNCKTSDEMKLEAIKTAIKEIRNLSKGEVSALGFIGGEFFQGQLHHLEVKSAFMELVDVSNSLLSNGYINELWFNATLIDTDQSDLMMTIDRIENKDKLWILTSYDTKGRFHNLGKLSSWISNVHNLHSCFPEVRLNTTMIITGDFIEQYLSGKLDLHKFKQEYGTKLFLKTPVKPDDLCDKSKEEINDMLEYEFFPRELDFMKFLMKYKESEGETEFANLFSNDLKAGELHKNFNNDELRNVVFTRSSDFKEELHCDKNLKEIEENKCGHSSIYNCFVDTDGCAVCCKNIVASL